MDLRGNEHFITDCKIIKLCETGLVDPVFAHKLLCFDLSFASHPLYLCYRCPILFGSSSQVVRSPSSLDNVDINFQLICVPLMKNFGEFLQTFEKTTVPARFGLPASRNMVSVSGFAARSLDDNRMPRDERLSIFL